MAFVSRDEMPLFAGHREEIRRGRGRIQCSVAKDWREEPTHEGHGEREREQALRAEMRHSLGEMRHSLGILLDSPPNPVKHSS